MRESTLWILGWSDALYLEDPCSGGRRMVDDLAQEGIPLSRNRIRNLMRCMDLQAIQHKPRMRVTGDPSVRFTCWVDHRPLKSVDQV